MIKKLAFAALAVFIGKKLVDAQAQSGATFRAASSGEHIPTDLLPGVPRDPGQRAVRAFRPDPYAPSTPEEREAMRPATIPLRH